MIYIPSTPLTLQNITYVARQRSSFLAGIPPPDFPQDPPGEGEFVGRGVEGDLVPVGVGDDRAKGEGKGRLAMGFGDAEGERFREDEEGIEEGVRRLRKLANEALFGTKNETKTVRDGVEA